jgi:hypothetical protein
MLVSTDRFEHPALTQQTLQIEQFIESIFPTQTAATYRQGAPAPVDKSGTTLTPEEQEAQKKQQAQDKEEFFYIMLAVGATLFVITAIMVRTLLQPPARLPLLTTLAVLHRLDDGRTLGYCLATASQRPHLGTQDYR